MRKSTFSCNDRCSRLVDLFKPTLQRHLLLLTRCLVHIGHLHAEAPYIGIKVPYFLQNMWTKTKIQQTQYCFLLHVQGPNQALQNGSHILNAAEIEKNNFRTCRVKLQVIFNLIRGRYNVILHILSLPWF